MKNNDYKTVNRYILLASKYLNLSLIGNPYSIDTRLFTLIFLCLLILMVDLIMFLLRWKIKY